MNRIEEIIREEIERFIINENNTEFNELLNCGNHLENKLLPQLGGYAFQNNEKEEVKQYFAKLEVYVFQIIFAIKRCVNKQSINEGFWSNLGNGIVNTAKGLGAGAWTGFQNNNRGLSAYGINLPNSINFWNNAKASYRATKRQLNNKNQNGNGDTVDSRVDKNTIPSRQLSVLLNEDYKWYVSQYENLNRKYGNNIDLRIPQAILTYINGDLRRTYNNIALSQQQSQGTQNP